MSQIKRKERDEDALECIGVNDSEETSESDSSDTDTDGECDSDDSEKMSPPELFSQSEQEKKVVIEEKLTPVYPPARVAKILIQPGAATMCLHPAVSRSRLLRELWNHAIPSGSKDDVFVEPTEAETSSYVKTYCGRKIFVNFTDEDYVTTHEYDNLYGRDAFFVAYKRCPKEDEKAAAETPSKADNAVAEPTAISATQ